MESTDVKLWSAVGHGRNGLAGIEEGLVLNFPFFIKVVVIHSVSSVEDHETVFVRTAHEDHHSGHGDVRADAALEFQFSV